MTSTYGRPGEYWPDGTEGYKWVLEYAHRQYAESIADYRRVDDKAAAMLNYLGAGTGLVTLGSVSSAVLDKASVWVLLACLPSVAMGLVSMLVAALARHTAILSGPPLPTDAAIFAEHCESMEVGELDLIARLSVSIEANRRTTARKAGLVDQSLRIFAVGVACLLLPLGVVIVEKACAEWKGKPAEPVRVVIDKAP